MEVDLDATTGGYSGTFRWAASKRLKSMPDMIEKHAAHHVSLDYENGWMGYFLSRIPHDDTACANFIKSVKEDLSIIDCLSTPVSIPYICRRLNLLEATQSVVNVVMIGCSEKAEERIARETNCFEELCLGFPDVEQINVFLVGPEILSTDSPVKPSSGRLRIKYFKGTAIQFFRANPSLLRVNGNTFVVGVNCGFGNFENPLPARYELLMSWLPDLFFLTATKLPLLFMCANDYADLAGESAVMLSVCGANFLASPSQNPFSFASTLVPERRATTQDDYSCGNSYWYAVYGFSKSRRQQHLQVLLKDSVGYESNVGDTRKMVLQQVRKVLAKHNPPTDWNPYCVTVSVKVLADANVEEVKESLAAAKLEEVKESLAAAKLEEVKEGLDEMKMPRESNCNSFGNGHCKVNQLYREDKADPINEAIVVTVEFAPDVICSRAADIEFLLGGAASRQFKVRGKLTSNDSFEETVQLRASVIPASATAKFSAKKRQLTISLAVCSE
jgi:hypothetical protein